MKDLKLSHKGKTRETYEIPGNPELRLVVVSDRISTHNVVHKSVIPGKGAVLNALTIWWLTGVLRNIPNHLEAFGQKIFDYLPGGVSDYPSDLAHRALIIKHLRMIPIEFIYRYYLTGSLYEKFYRHGRPDPYGLGLPPGLRLMHRFDQPMFTPTDKSETDDPMLAHMVEAGYHEEVELGRVVMEKGQAQLNKVGLTLLDSKFEIGRGPFLADEVLTPDSSRFCLQVDITEGVEPMPYDKQFVRNWAEKTWGEGLKKPLVFSDDVIRQTSCIYKEVFEMITGRDLDWFQRHHLS